MDRLVEGDRAAFDPLFEALHPRAIAVARRRLGDADADDAAQRTMTAVFARSAEFTKGRPVLPWFYAIAANETHAIARRSATERARTAPDSAAASLPAPGDPEAALVDAEMRAALWAAIEELDPLSASAIRAQLAGDDLSSTDASAAALRKRVSRAYARLRLVLGGRA